MAQSWDTAGRKAILGCIQIGTHTQTEKEKNRIGLHLGTTSASLLYRPFYITSPYIVTFFQIDTLTTVARLCRSMKTALKLETSSLDEFDRGPDHSCDLHSRLIARSYARMCSQRKVASKQQFYTTTCNVHPPCPDSDKLYQIKWKVEYSTLKGRSCNMYYCNKLGRQDLCKLSSFRNKDIVHYGGEGNPS